MKNLNKTKKRLKFIVESRYKMIINIVVDVDIEESGLNEDNVKDNIINFTKDLLIIGADEQGIGLTLKEVSY